MACAIFLKLFFLSSTSLCRSRPNSFGGGGGSGLVLTGYSFRFSYTSFSSFFFINESIFSAFKFVDLEVGV